MGNEGRGKPFYLSLTICEKIIDIMGNKVLKNILKETLEAKYFSLSVNSAPSQLIISHTDELTVVLRYVGVSDGDVAERFLTFNTYRKSQRIAIAKESNNRYYFKFFKETQYRHKKYDNQPYGNASNISGCYNGLQAHIMKINQLARYIPCVVH